MNVSIIEWCMCALVALFALMIFKAIRHAKREKEEAPWGKFPVSKRPFPSDEELIYWKGYQINWLPDRDVSFLADYLKNLIDLGGEEFCQIYNLTCQVLENRRLERKMFFEMEKLPSGADFPSDKALLHCSVRELKKFEFDDLVMLLNYATTKTKDGKRKFEKVRQRVSRAMMR